MLNEFARPLGIYTILALSTVMRLRHSNGYRHEATHAFAAAGCFFQPNSVKEFWKTKSADG